MPPSQAAAAVPPELDGLVMRSLAKDPDDRFQSAEEMRGLVQYSLQMLQVQGGHTGTWNTGPVNVHDGGHTAAMNIGGSTAAMAHPMHGDTSQGPILPPMNPDDGAYAGGQHNGGGRGKMWLFVLLALIAIGAGVAFALQAANDDGGKKKSPASPSTSVTPSPTPSSPEPTDEETEETEEPNNSSGGQTWPTSEPTWSQTNEPTEPTQEPTDTPTSPGPGTSDGGSTTTDGGTGDNGGATDGGTEDGGTGDDEGATSEGTSAGTSAGAAAGTAAGPTGTTGQ